MSYSPENPSLPSHENVRNDNEQFNFMNQMEAEEAPEAEPEKNIGIEGLKKFPLDFGEEAVFNPREPNVVWIHGNAQGTSASIHFSNEGKILDITINAPYSTVSEAQLREVFRSKAVDILKTHRDELGITET